MKGVSSWDGRSRDCFSSLVLRRPNCCSVHLADVLFGSFESVDLRNIFPWPVLLYLRCGDHWWLFDDLYSPDFSWTSLPSSPCPQFYSAPAFHSWLACLLLFPSFPPPQVTLVHIDNRDMIIFGVVLVEAQWGRLGRGGRRCIGGRSLLSPDECSFRLFVRFLISYRLIISLISNFDEHWFYD